jgi:hypothetical protein
MVRHRQGLRLWLWLWLWPRIYNWMFEYDAIYYLLAYIQYSSNLYIPLKKFIKNLQSTKKYFFKQNLLRGIYVSSE